jgi:hypothetical protein
LKKGGPGDTFWGGLPWKKGFRARKSGQKVILGALLDHFLTTFWTPFWTPRFGFPPGMGKCAKTGSKTGSKKGSEKCQKVVQKSLFHTFFAPEPLFGAPPKAKRVWGTPFFVKSGGVPRFQSGFTSVEEQIGRDFGSRGHDFGSAGHKKPL